MTDSKYTYLFDLTYYFSAYTKWHDLCSTLLPHITLEGYMYQVNIHSISISPKPLREFRLHSDRPRSDGLNPADIEPGSVSSYIDMSGYLYLCIPVISGEKTLYLVPPEDWWPKFNV